MSLNTTALALHGIGGLSLTSGILLFGHGVFCESEEYRSALFIFLGATSLAGGVCIFAYSFMLRLRAHIRRIMVDCVVEKPPSIPLSNVIPFHGAIH